MDEVFDSLFLLQEDSTSPSYNTIIINNKDKTIEQVESSVVEIHNFNNKNMVQADSSVVIIAEGNNYYNYENNEVLGHVSKPNNNNSIKTSKIDILDMDIELEDGIVIIGHASDEKTITPEKNNQHEENITNNDYSETINLEKNDQNVENTTNYDKTISPEENQEYTAKNDETISFEENEEKKEKKRISRKRVRHPDTWKQYVRKNKRETGEEYIDIKGNLHEKRKIKFGCIRQNCKYKCSEKINAEKRQQIHETFWKLSDSKKITITANMSKEP